jgi:cobaltochelatase CobS
MTDSQPAFAFPNGMQKKHADFVAVACMNTWGKGATAAYVGRFKQDDASMDRFVRIYIDYDRAIESQLGDADICARVWALRDACTELQIQHTVSTRMIERCTKLRTAGWTNENIDEYVLFAGLSDGVVKQLTHKINAATNGAQ